MYIVGVLSATEGKALPTELRKEEKALRHKIEMEDEVTEKPKVCMCVGKRSPTSNLLTHTSGVCITPPNPTLPRHPSMTSMLVLECWTPKCVSQQLVIQAAG